MNPMSRVVTFGAVIGRFLDLPIHDWLVDDEGLHYKFVRALPAVTLTSGFVCKLSANEMIHPPGLLYRSTGHAMPCARAGDPPAMM